MVRRREAIKAQAWRRDGNIRAGLKGRPEKVGKTYVTPLITGKTVAPRSSGLSMVTSSGSSTFHTEFLSLPAALLGVGVLLVWVTLGYTYRGIPLAKMVQIIVWKNKTFMLYINQCEIPCRTQWKKTVLKNLYSINS